MEPAEGYILGALEAWRRGSPGVSAQGMCTRGSAQEPGRTLRSPRSNPGLGSGLPISPGLQAKGAGTLWERISGRNRGTAKRRKRSAAVPRLRPSLRSHRVRTPSACGPGLIDHPGSNRDSTAEITGFSQVPGRTPMCTCPGLIPRGTPDARPIRRRGDSLPLVPRHRLPDLDLSRLITTACTLAVYASQRRVTPTPRKTRFRWVATLTG